jgi:hypothetical protein
MSNDSGVLKIIRKNYGADSHPALVLAEVAFDVKQDIELRMNASKALMPYCESQLKTIEVRGQIDHNVGLLRVNLFKPKETPATPLIELEPNGD